MPRTKKIPDNIDENKQQEILVPLLDTNESTVSQVEIPLKKFEKPLKKFGVYLNGEFLQEVDENSDEINNFLNENKEELDLRIQRINEIVSDPNLLIFFHEGKQNRTYMSFEAYYNQNGLAPKILKYDSWAKYYRSVNSLLSDEEIAIHKFGDLPYAFVILESDD